MFAGPVTYFSATSVNLRNRINSIVYVHIIMHDGLGDMQIVDKL